MPTSQVRRLGGTYVGARPVADGGYRHSCVPVAQSYTPQIYNLCSAPSRTRHRCPARPTSSPADITNPT